MKTESVLTKNQKKVFTRSEVMLDGEKVDIIATVRYDDECNNGRNTFSITGNVYEAGKRSDAANIMGGCIHKEIAQFFPELAPLIKWHLTSSDSPLYYCANTMYHARDTDYDGLKAGDYSAYTTLVQGTGLRDDGEPVTLYTTKTLYTNRRNNSNLAKSNDAVLLELKLFTDALCTPYILVDEPCEWSISKGKEINLEAARSCAVWSEATLEQLQSRDALEARLPALMDEFRAAVESIGFIY